MTFKAFVAIDVMAMLQPLMVTRFSFLLEKRSSPFAGNILKACHCERSVGKAIPSRGWRLLRRYAPRNDIMAIIASEAKQSPRADGDCFVAAAPRNDIMAVIASEACDGSQ